MVEYRAMAPKGYFTTWAMDTTLRGGSERFENAIAKLCNWANAVDLEE